MSDAQDRVAMVSDLRAFEERSKDDLNALEPRLEERVKRHFDVVAERIESCVKIIAGANTHHMRTPFG